MSQSRWKELLENIDVVGDIVPVAEHRLDVYEVGAKLRLPKTYREYCTVFGPGRLNGVISTRIAVPGERTWEWMAELELFNEHFLKLDSVELEEYCPDPQLWRNGIFFGDNQGDLFLWNKSEVLDEQTHEMAIYVVLRDMETHRLADSFESFVFDVCLEHGTPGRGKLDSPPSFLAGSSVV
jgi:hypothetical protein